VGRSAPQKYFLSPAQIKQWLARASAKGILVPEEMLRALEIQASTQSNTPQSDAARAPDRKQKGSETTEKRTPSTREEVPMLFVRRMLPSEYEKLQGFPKNWTATDIEL
jgi:hypothetical protein